LFQRLFSDTASTADVIWCRWDNNIMIDLTEMVCGLDSSGSVQGPLADSCEHGTEPLVFSPS
jgi:hypothetical protein